MTKLSDIMTMQLTTTDAGATLKEVATLMAQEDIGSVLIMDGDDLRGIITDRDIVVRAVAFGHDFGTPVTDYTTEGVYSMDADTDVQDAAREMAGRQIKRLPVTRGGKVVGIVSLADLANLEGSTADKTALEGISKPT
ncbi:CBS domain-containing protein [Deinococcus sp. KSM4-11]|uniref:CBS domain-containing protein n=1 Tax=Deinococcus sp. KSM4-11 TaxID=2568654 RepID=UPI0010A51A8E|nr:CBS domain-containing protein [Deinococcus sp. KSM4-11]THF83586.1 CBS domain-containing protein [Deinococcus sp. KSM4-11]